MSVPCGLQLSLRGSPQVGFVASVGSGSAFGKSQFQVIPGAVHMPLSQLYFLSLSLSYKMHFGTNGVEDISLEKINSTRHYNEINELSAYGKAPRGGAI